ncbi:hypothetical protein HYV50_00060 [Candidatus Pacearchaeota archaeon]|nr:hypothetical protein [Candidatus Pacearchaeota archaeon]
MVSKQIWITLIIAGVGAIIIAFVTANITTNALFPIRLNASTVYTRASACDADDKCEVRSIAPSLTGENILLNGNTRISGNLQVDGANKAECQVYNYGNETISGEQTCINSGYDYCLIAQYSEIERYWTSANRSCTGQTQVQMKRPFLGACPGLMGGGGGGCGFNNNGAEPYYGDIGFSSPGMAEKIVCCR